MRYILPIILATCTVACAEAWVHPPDADQAPVANDWNVEEPNEQPEEPEMIAVEPRLPTTPVGPEGPSTAPVEEEPDPERFRADVVDLVNQVRETGADCGSEGVFAPAEPMEDNPQLNAAARRHSQDMARHDFLDHEGSDGGRFWDRTEQAGYPGVARGENVAGGYPTPEEVVQGWLDSDGHCLVLMLPETNEVGVGYAFNSETRYGHFWTMVTGVR